MKRINLTVLIFVLLISMLFLAGCKDDSEEENAEITLAKGCKIQYTDDTGVHSLNVTKGESYSITELPSRYGYEFLGLYDASVGGTQYVNPQGTSNDVYANDGNIVLFPQFKAKEFKLFLDYSGAPVTESRELDVSYDSTIVALPKNLKIENMDFVGWFTESNGNGLQVADANGIISKNAKITEKNFDLTDSDGYISLYAHFKTSEHTLTLYVGSDATPKEIKVKHGTYIQNIRIEERTDGKAVLSWSKIKNDVNKTSVFEGKILEDTVLYSCELAPVIELDTAGGELLNDFVAPAGTSIALPTPVRQNYKFLGWVDSNGEPYNAEIMPSESLRIKAAWQAMLVFDENGGDDVLDISLEAGMDISLPQTQKAGYIFAGWYTEDKTKYEDKKMPKESVVLRAGWYREQSRNVIISDRNGDTDKLNISSYIKFKDYYTSNTYQTFKIYFHIQVRSLKPDEVNSNSFYVGLYENGTKKIDGERFNDLTKAFKTYTFIRVFTANDDVEVYAYASGDNCYMYDCYYTVYYADLSKLYL